MRRREARTTRNPPPRFSHRLSAPPSAPLSSPPFSGRHVHRVLHLHHRRRLCECGRQARGRCEPTHKKNGAGHLSPLFPTPFPSQKIRTVELDGKVVKLQIVSVGVFFFVAGRSTVFFFLKTHHHLSFPLPLSSVGHRRPGTLPHHHVVLLPRRARHHRKS